MIWKSIPASKAPARPPFVLLFVAVITAAAALLALVGIGVLSGQLLLIPSMAGSMALIAAAPALPLAQPRSVIGGHVASAGVGIGVGFLSHALWAAALAGALAMGLMLLLRASHSPAAATAVIGVLTLHDRPAFLACAALAAIVLVGFGLARSLFKRTAYPVYWW